MAGKLGDAFLAIVPKLDDSAMSKAIGTVRAKLGGAAQAGKVAFAAIGAASTAAMGYVVKSSLDMYSAYEQNVGGIQKIFGNMGKSLDDYAALTGQTAGEARDKWSALEESQSAMLENAGKAWQTAGLSASAYMEQSTSFGAALVSSLGGDTRKAVDYANTAIVDMADNANTFGTSIQDIQNAYQGFAKQNYTMLDNLKLGYGGTQSEMKRLIKDASQMTDVQKRLGVTVDASSMSFDNIVAAIHVVQDSMQVGGTTAREAATTIEGSVNAMSAAWDNWLTGLASSDADMAALTQNLVEAFDNVVSNVVPRIAQIASTVMTELPGVVATAAPVLASSLAEMVQGAVDGLLASLPPQLQPIADGFADIATAVQASGIGDTLAHVFDGVPAVAPDVAESVGNLASDFADVLEPALEAASPFVQAIADALSDLLTHVDQVLPVVASLAAGFGAFQAIAGIAGAFSALSAALGPVGTAIGLVVEAVAGGAPLLGTLASAIGLVFSPATLVAAAIAGVVAVVVALATNAGGCRDMVVGAFTAIAGFVMQAGQTIGSIIITVIGAIGTFVAGVIEGAVSAGSGFVSSIGSFFSQLPGAIGGFLSGAIGAIAGFIGQCASNAASAGQSFLNGISNGFNSAVSFVAGIPSRIVSAIGNVGSLLANAGRSIIDGFLGGLKSAWGGVTDFVGGIAGWIQAHKGPISYDRTLLVRNGQAVMGSLLTGLKDSWGDVQGFVSGIAPAISDALSPDVSLATRGDACLARASAGATGRALDSGQSRVIAAIDALGERLSGREVAVYVDGRKLASTIARPMNQQLGVLAARGY